MKIIALHGRIPVEILDICTDGAGVKWASIRALEGTPFVGGDKWPIWAEFTATLLDELTLECACCLPEHNCPLCRAIARQVYNDFDQ